MRHRRVLQGVLGIAAVALLLTPQTARAQFLFFPFGGFGGFGGGGLYGYNYPNLLYSRAVFPNMGRGAFPGFNTPDLGQMGGVNPYAYNPLLYNAAFNMSGYAGGGMAYGGMGLGGMAYSPILLLPGFPANELARKRPTMEPALAVDRSSVIKQAAYGGTAEDRARIEIVVPSATAEVTLQGVAMKQTGTVREYVSPPLAEGKYVYDVKVRWTDSQGEHTLTRRLPVWAGATRRVDFTAKE